MSGPDQHTDLEAIKERAERGKQLAKTLEDWTLGAACDDTLEALAELVSLRKTLARQQERTIELEAALRSSERLAEEADALIRRGVVGSRSPLGDALLDYWDEADDRREVLFSGVVGPPC